MKNSNLKSKSLFLAILLVGVFAMTEKSWAATVEATSCLAVDVNAAIYLSSDGDVVQLPSDCTGTIIWGSNTEAININKAITLRGTRAKSDPIITVGTGPAIYINASGAKVENFKMVTDANTSSSANFFTFSGPAEQWVISGMDLDQTEKKLGYIFNLTSRRANTDNTYGVISGNTVMWDGEQVNYRGPCNSWDTAHSMGGAQALFVEGNIFNKRLGGSEGYWDSNANARTVFRYNTLNGVYLDAHGSWSNFAICSPETHPSSRQIEIYNNLWTGGIGWVSMYIRGGTGVLFNNHVTNTTYGRIFLDEYYVRSGKLTQPSWAYYPGACACIGDYPVVYQVGRGLNNNPSPSAGSDQSSEPMFIWNNIGPDGGELTISNNVYGGPSQACKDYCGNQSLTVADFIAPDRDYYTRAPQEGDYLHPYVPYVCPHPLSGLTGSCDESVTGIDGYDVENLGQIIRADVDGSSQINTTDALLTLRNSLGLSMNGTAWQVSSTTGDVNCDGVSNSTDALLILRYSLGLSMSETGWCE